MNTKTATLILAALVLLLSVGIYAQDKYLAKPDEEIYGAWANKDMHPPKTVDFAGGWRDCSTIADSTPTAGEGTEQIMSKRTDADGVIWYETFCTATSGQFKGYKWQRLNKLSKSSTVREFVTVAPVSDFDPKNFPDSVDPSNTSYRIYYRLEDAAALRHDLIVAIEDGTAKDVQAVIDKGVDVKVRGENGWTYLILAAGGNKHPDVITALLKAGSDINAQGDDGETALMHSARYNDNPEIVRVLLMNRANAKLKNNNGETALDCAQDNDNLEGTDALRLLKEASK